MLNKPSHYSDGELYANTVHLIEQGLDLKKIGDMFGVSKMGIKYHIKRLGLLPLYLFLNNRGRYQQKRTARCRGIRISRENLMEDCRYEDAV